VSVLFTGKCGDKDGADCEDKISGLVASLETINDDINNIGIEFVMAKEKKLARQLCAMAAFPAIALFRNGGHCTVFPGSLDSEVAILNWISDTETIEVEGIIEEVNIDMLQNIIESEDEVCIQSPRFIVKLKWYNRNSLNPSSLNPSSSNPSSSNPSSSNPVR
jgi:hypothetical protein